MFTKNGNLALLSMAYQSKIGFRATDGHVEDESYSHIQSFFNGTELSVTFGNGTTKETSLDYKLETPVDITVNSLTVSNVLPSATYTEDTWKNGKLKYSAVITNDTNEDITISEVGLFMNISGARVYMFYRETFEPIIISPGASHSIVIDLG